MNNKLHTILPFFLEIENAAGMLVSLRHLSTRARQQRNGGANTEQRKHACLSHLRCKFFTYVVSVMCTNFSYGVVT